MPRRLAVLCLAAALGTGSAAAAGCGDGDPPPLDAAQTAKDTAAKGTARVATTLTAQGSPLPIPISVEGEGVTALDRSAGVVTFDLAPLLRFAGAPAGAPGDLEGRFGGPRLHAKPPRIEQLPVPGGKSWVAVDGAALAEELGLPGRAVGRLLTLDPAGQLRALRTAKGLERVDEEDVGGVGTTHYRGTTRLADRVAALPAGERAEAEAAVRRLRERSPGSGLEDPSPVDYWIGEDGLARKMTSSLELPGQGGTPAGRLELTSVLSGFGAALDAGPPPAGETYDATDEALRALRGAGIAP